MNLKRWSAAALLVAFSACSLTADAQVLLRDDFTGNGFPSPPINVDTTVWRLPFGSEGTFVGRTQYRGDSAVDMPQQGVFDPTAALTSGLGNMSSGDATIAQLHLDTYSPIDPGNQFLGTDLLTKRNFALGGGLSFEGRLRLNPASDILEGTVGGLFLFDVQGDSPPGSGTFFRDEIDFELIGNQTVGAATQDIATNYWNDGDFSNGGDLEFHDVAGLDLTQYQTYRVDWTPNSIKWYVNGSMVRIQTEDVPDDPQKLHLNLWAPDTSFGDAFNAALQPTAVEANNQRVTLDVDHVEVKRFNTTTGDNLLTFGDFEDPSIQNPGEQPTLIGTVPATTTGEWIRFNNAFYEFDGGTNTPTEDINTLADEGMDDGGFTMLKMFGPFIGTPGNFTSDASGVFQNVAAMPGQEFEASVFSQTVNGDSILGTNNFTQLGLSFLDANGTVISEEFASMGNFQDENGASFPLLDGRDANIVEDVWVEGFASGIAPAGTAFARISLFFIQVDDNGNVDGGAAFFDGAELRLLTADTVALEGDFNLDGMVDAADYAIFRDNLGQSDAALNGNGSGDITGLVVAADYAVWAANYGATSTTSTSATVPEPSSLVLLATMALFAQRKRVR